MSAPSLLPPPATKPLHIVILGLSITSSWGNGHATTYRALVRALDQRGHVVLFLERDVPWYAENRDLAHPPYAATQLYQDLSDLQVRFTPAIRSADLVIVGSYVPDGVAVGDWVLSIAQGVTAFYDIDTPVTLAKLSRGDHEYLAPNLIPRYHLYLSFSSGPLLDILKHEYGAYEAYPFYCAVDPEIYCPETCPTGWDLGYMGTYSPDRQPALELLLLAVAHQKTDGRFIVAGPSFPETTPWPANVQRIEHLPPQEHRHFYNSQRYTLNLTRADMRKAGYSPSVRLFEAAACGVPIISDLWTGLDSFFEVGREIFVAQSTSDVLHILDEVPEKERRAIADRARSRVLQQHTAAQRAYQLENYVTALYSH